MVSSYYLSSKHRADTWPRFSAHDTRAQLPNIFNSQDPSMSSPAIAFLVHACYWVNSLFIWRLDFHFASDTALSKSLQSYTHVNVSILIHEILCLGVVIWFPISMADIPFGTLLWVAARPLLRLWVSLPSFRIVVNVHLVSYASLVGMA